MKTHDSFRLFTFQSVRRFFLGVATCGAAVLLSVPAHADLIGYWGLDEFANPSSGTVAIDYSSNALDGVYQPLGGVGGPILGENGATSDTGTAASFNGTTDEVFLGSPAQLKMTNNFTIAAWIKPDVTPNAVTQRILSQFPGSVAPTTGYGFGIIGNEFKFTSYGIKDYIPSNADAFTIPIGQWTHVAAVMGTDNSVTFYQNGRYVSRVTHTLPARANTDNRNFFIGATGVAERFDGTIDDVQVYNTAMNAAGVRAIYGLPVAPRLLGHWKLDETVNPSGNTQAADSSGNGRNGTYQPLSGVDAGPDVGIPGAPRLGATAADFNGTNDEIFLGSPTAFRMPNDFTIMAWINPDSVNEPGRTQRIFSQNGGGYGFGLIGGELKFTTYGIKDYQGSTADGISVESGKWTHVAVVFDVDNDASFYLNGQFVEKIDGVTQANIGTSNFFIGRTGVVEPFGGLLDDVRIYQGSLTQAQILEAAAIPEPSTIVLAWLGSTIGAVAMRRRLASRR